MRLLLSDITPSKAMLHSPQGGHSVGPWWGNSPALSSKAPVPTEPSPVCRRVSWQDREGLQFYLHSFSLVLQKETRKLGYW